MNKQITIDQHFLPQCYLKQFTNGDWKVFAYTKEWTLLTKKYLPQSIGYKELLYELNVKDPDNKIENIFSKIENNYADLSVKLLSLSHPDNYSLTEEEQITLFLFVMRLSLWNPSKYDNLNSDNFDALRKRELEVQNLSDEDKRNSLNNLDEHNRRSLPISIYAAFHPYFVNQIILRKKIVFLISWGDAFFLTSDNPVVDRCEKWTWILNYPTLGDINYWVALSPYVYLRIVDKDIDPEVENLSLCKDRYWDIARNHNKIMYKQCQKFVYWDALISPL